MRLRHPSMALIVFKYIRIPMLALSDIFNQQKRPWLILTIFLSALIYSSRFIQHFSGWLNQKHLEIESWLINQIDGVSAIFKIGRFQHH